MDDQHPKVAVDATLREVESQIADLESRRNALVELHRRLFADAAASDAALIPRSVCLT